nr:aliphatic sulfonate ABC transporter substrate-binding protein [Raoultella sp. NCTC 9187]
MRKLLAPLALGGLLMLSALSHAAQSAPDALRIGYQKGSVSMVLAKATSCWNSATRAQNLLGGVSAGPQMLEALNVGSIDIGSTGDIPPIFAQAAGADLVYVGAEPPKPKAEVILVAETARSKRSRS